MEWDEQSEKELQEFKVVAKAYSLHLETMVGFNPAGTAEKLLAPMVLAGLGTCLDRIAKERMGPIDAISYMGIRMEGMNVAWIDMCKRHPEYKPQDYKDYLILHYTEEYTNWMFVREALPFLCDIDISNVELEKADYEFLGGLKTKLDTLKKAANARHN